MNAPVGRNDVTAPIPVVSSTGMRKNAGIAAVAIFCFLLGVMFLIRVSDMTELSKSVSSLRASITRTQQENTELEKQLAQLCSEVNVGYEAAKLGMISAKSVDVIYLIASETPGQRRYTLYRGGRGTARAQRVLRHAAGTVTVQGNDFLFAINRRFFGGGGGTGMHPELLVRKRMMLLTVVLLTLFALAVARWDS